MKYGCVCSGIGAASVAWKPLGWECLYHSEIAKFPKKVLSLRHPDTPLHGDFTTIKDTDYGQEDLIIGGTPCQSFSMAGWRRGLDDSRGNLALEFVKFIERRRPTWFVWENVRGALTVDGGEAFGSLTGAMAELGYGFAWRLLDAQYFGVPQRRQRLFIVGYLGDWRPPTAVLLERHSLQRNFAPSKTYEPPNACFFTRDLDRDYYRLQGFGDYDLSPIAGPIKARDYKSPTDLIREGNKIRRLTVTELERLQGLPDGYTAIPWNGRPKSMCPHEPRYTALGNTMAVPVMEWIGERVNAVRLLVSERSS